jgi:hypothetical protein
MVSIADIKSKYLRNVSMDLFISSTIEKDFIINKNALIIGYRPNKNMIPVYIYNNQLITFANNSYYAFNIE